MMYFKSLRVNSMLGFAEKNEEVFTKSKRREFLKGKMVCLKKKSYVNVYNLFKHTVPRCFDKGR